LYALVFLYPGVLAMKWFKLLMGVMFLAAVMTVPTGCGKEQITEMKPGADAPPPAAGHEAAAKAMNKKPENVK
jgi:hypothetical protein